MNALSSAGSVGSATRVTLTETVASLPASSDTRQSAANATSTVFSSPTLAPTSASSMVGCIMSEPSKVPATSEPSAGTRSRSEEHTSELQSLMRISYAVFCLKKKKKKRVEKGISNEKQT